MFFLAWKISKVKHSVNEDEKIKRKKILFSPSRKIEISLSEPHFWGHSRQRFSFFGIHPFIFMNIATNTNKKLEMTNFVYSHRLWLGFHQRQKEKLSQKWLPPNSTHPDYTSTIASLGEIIFVTYFPSFLRFHPLCLAVVLPCLCSYHQHLIVSPFLLWVLSFYCRVGTRSNL